VDLDLYSSESDCRGGFSASGRHEEYEAARRRLCGGIRRHWIEKGMGLIIPGFVPSTLDQLDRACLSGRSRPVFGHSN
jgi:hypothetical protein